jgi:hypothetical protein
MGDGVPEGTKVTAEKSDRHIDRSGKMPAEKYV